MYKKIDNTVFGVGYINDEFLIAPQGEFNYGNNNMVDTESVITYEDETTGLVLYNYKDKLLTFKELRLEYLVDHYKIDR